MNFTNDEKYKQITVDELKLSVRSSNALHRGGIHTLYQLIERYNKEEIQSISNLGKKSFEEIEDKLKYIGSNGIEGGQVEATEAAAREMAEEYAVPEGLAEIEIFELAASVRLKNCLLRGGYRTVGEILKLSLSDFSSIWGAGVGTIEEFRDLTQELKKKGMAYFDDHKPEEIEVDDKHRRTVDIATVNRLREEYGFKTAWLMEWYGVSRQRVYQMLDKKVNSGNWLNREFSETEESLLSEMLENKELYIETEDGVRAYLLNNRQDDCAVVFVNDEEIKCFFLDVLPDEFAKRIREIGLDRLTPEELNISSLGRSVFILRKEYFIPENSLKFHQFASMRNMSVEDYCLFLTGLPLTTNQSTVTDEKILDFLRAHFIDGKLMIPSNNSTVWFRSFISRNGYSIDQIAELYGLGVNEETESDSSDDNIEEDMREYDGAEGWLQELYAQNPLIGNKRVSEKTKEKLYTITKKYIDQILREPLVKVPLTVKMQITLMVVLFAREWDSGDESGFWKYITSQFGYRDDTGRLRGILCDYILESMQRNHRWFISSATGYQYKSTIVTHALTTKRSWMRLYDFLFDFYKENMDWTYVEDDPIVYRMVEALKTKLIAGDDSDDEKLEISNRVYSFQEGIRKLVIFRTGYAATLISHMLHRIDDLVNHAEKPAKYYVDELCDKWIEGRLRGEQESKSKEQTRTSRAIAVDYSRIRPVYSLVNETSIRISLPDIRLKKTEFEKAELKIYVSDELVETKSLSFYGNELGKTLSGFDIDVCRAVTKGDGKLNLRVTLLCDTDIIYDSKETLYRELICFSGTREVSVSNCEMGSYSVFYPMNKKVEFIGAEVSAIDAVDGLEGVFVRLGDDFLIRCGNSILAYDEKSSANDTGLRVVLPKTQQCIRYQKNGKQYAIISEKENIHVIVKEGYDFRKSRITMNGSIISLQNALCEKAGEDCIYKLPIETGTDEICEFEVFDLDSGRFIAKESVRYMPKISWRFDKNLYYEAKDYENAFVRFYDAAHGYTESFGREDESVVVPLVDGSVSIRIPKLFIRNDKGEQWNTCESFWIKDFQQNDKLYVSLPEGFEAEIKVGNVDVSSESRGIYALGNAVFAYSSADSTDWINVTVLLKKGSEEWKYVIGKISERERFISTVKFDYIDKKLYWNRGNGFIGSKEGTVNLRISGSGENRVYPLDLDYEIAAENMDLPLGEYSFSIVKASENIFSTDEEILSEGSLFVGDENELRFNNAMIKITHITNEFEEDFGSIEIKGTYIDHIEYLGIQYVGSEDRECPVYRGIMFYMGQSGKHHEFSYADTESEEGYLLYEVNPVTVVYINAHTLSITNEDGQGIYYFRYFNKDRMANVYMLTDREPNARTERNYNVADLYIFDKERL